MRLSTPRWWYLRREVRRPALATALVLAPFSFAWAWVTARRIRRAVPADPGAPVICVGNLTLGGVGKTPIVEALLERLAARGVRAAGLSRGHGGALEGPVRVDPAVHTAAEVGDEALEIAADHPMWIARDRAAGARAAVSDRAGVVVMDDGHQNPSVRKTLSLVAVDGETRDGEWPFGDGRVFPAGPMREPLKAGLARADAIVLVQPLGVPEPDPELTALFAGKPVLVARIAPTGPPPPGPRLGFAGVGKPWKVERSLRDAGCDLVDFVGFPDHAAFSEATLARLERYAEGFGAGLVTTRKDWMRLSPAWRDKVAPWPVKARFDDPAALDALLDRVLEA